MEEKLSKSALLTRIKELGIRLEEVKTEIVEEEDEQHREHLLTEEWDLEITIEVLKAEFRGVKKKLIMVDYDFSQNLQYEVYESTFSCGYCKSNEHDRKCCPVLESNVRLKIEKSGTQKSIEYCETFPEN